MRTSSTPRNIDPEDWRELQDPKIARQITEGYREYREGKARPIEEFIAELRKEEVAKRIAQ